MRFARLVAGYPELVLVLVAAGLGLLASRPLRVIGNHQAINVFLALLVFATALTISSEALAGLSASWRQLAAVLVVGITVLPALSWVAARLVAAGPLRDGVMCIGLAPCEIASIATTALAGGDAALAAAVLIGSTGLSVGVGGVILSLEVPGVRVHPLHILVDLVAVVALPLAAGMALRARLGPSAARDGRCAKAAIAALGVLVALIAAEVHVGPAYLGLLGAIVLVIAVSALGGWALGRTTSAARAVPLLLTVSMRDFAIAAGLATAAFGPAAAAPLGLYGVVVLIWGTAVAGRIRARPAPESLETGH